MVEADIRVIQNALFDPPIQATNPELLQSKEKNKLS